MEKIKVKIILNNAENTPRAEFFRDLLQDSMNYQVINPKGEFNNKPNSKDASIHLLIDLPKGTVKEVTEFIGSLLTTSNVILDYTLFSTRHITPEIQYLFSTLVDSVITDNAFTQQDIYTNTGVLASIVNAGLVEDEMYDPSTVNVTTSAPVGWLGKPDSLFTFLRIVNTHKKVKFAVASPNTRKIIDKALYPNIVDYYNANKQKQLTSFLKETSFIYLPYTYSKETEFERLFTFIFLTLRGKLVVLEYPDDLPFSKKEIDRLKQISFASAQKMTVDEINKEVLYRQQQIKVNAIDNNNPLKFLESSFEEAILKSMEQAEEALLKTENKS